MTYIKIRIWRELAREKRELANALAADGIIPTDAIEATHHYEALVSDALAELGF